MYQEGKNKVHKIRKDILPTTQQFDKTGGFYHFTAFNRSNHLESYQIWSGRCQEAWGPDYPGQAGSWGLSSQCYQRVYPASRPE